MKVFLTSMHIGQRITSFQGVELGTVVDFVIDEETATLSFAVVAAGEAEQLGERLLIIPWGAFSPGQNGRGLRLGINQDRLKRAPAMERSELDSLGDKQVRMWVLSYYGLAPSRVGNPDEDRLLGRIGRQNPGKRGADGEALAKMLAAAGEEREEEEPAGEEVEEPGEGLDEETWQEAA
jgi:sporulation protein YlmC with PRC-barrel domain